MRLLFFAIFDLFRKSFLASKPFTSLVNMSCNILWNPHCKMRLRPFQPSESIWKRLNCIFLPSLISWRLFALGLELLIGLSPDSGCSEQLQQEATRLHFHPRPHPPPVTARTSHPFASSLPQQVSVCVCFGWGLLGVATVASGFAAAVCIFMVNRLKRVNVAFSLPN